MQELAAAYPTATKIRLVQDNLNTHNFSSFYQHLPADEAHQLAQRFELYYTPRAASWLNMIEIEFSALARQCLNRRMPSQQQLQREVLVFFKDRTDKQVKINWQFSLDKARNRLNRHYQKVNLGNAKFKIT